MVEVVAAGVELIELIELEAELIDTVELGRVAFDVLLGVLVCVFDVPSGSEVTPVSEVTAGSGLPLKLDEVSFSTLTADVNLPVLSGWTDKTSRKSLWPWHPDRTKMHITRERKIAMDFFIEFTSFNFMSDRTKHMSDRTKHMSDRTKHMSDRTKHMSDRTKHEKSLRVQRA